MPRFYFHTEDGQPQRDREGLELPDVASARREATLAVGDLLRERADELWRDGILRVCVTDDEGLTLFFIDVSATASPAVDSSFGLARRPGGAPLK